MPIPTTITVGTVFGRFTILEVRVSYKGTSLTCQCHCGRIVTAPKANFIHTKSIAKSTCGIGACVHGIGWKHGMSRKHDLTYQSWVWMWKRCRDKDNPRYGGRGITVCDRWKDFTAFLSDLGPRPSQKHSIERENHNGNYCPSNCHWATNKEQGRNKCTTRLVTIHGVTKRGLEWAEQIGIRSGTLYERIRRGWSDSQLILPHGKPYHRKKTKHPK